MTGPEPQDSSEADVEEALTEGMMRIVAESMAAIHEALLQAATTGQPFQLPKDLEIGQHNFSEPQWRILCVNLQIFIGVKAEKIENLPAKGLKFRLKRRKFRLLPGPLPRTLIIERA